MIQTTNLGRGTDNYGYYNFAVSGRGNPRISLVCSDQVAPTPTPRPTPVSCSSPYTCWKDKSSDIVWAMGGDSPTEKWGAWHAVTADCKSMCASALGESTDFYVCKSDEPIHGNRGALQAISGGLGFTCKSDKCGFSAEAGTMLVDTTQNSGRTCIFPTAGVNNFNHRGDNYYSCDAIA